MKTVFLVRHARAVKRQKKLPDVERSLVPRGQKESRKVARNLCRAKIAPNLLISSHANRAIQTAHLFAKELEYAVQKVLIREVVYEAGDGADLMAMLHGLDDAFGSAMIFGHEPTLSDLACRLVPMFNFTMPKSGVVGIDLPVDKWGQVEGESGTIVYLDAPLDERKEEGLRRAAQKALEQALVDTASVTLKYYDEQMAEKQKRQVTKMARQLAESIVNGKKGLQEARKLWPKLLNSDVMPKMGFDRISD